MYEFLKEYFDRIFAISHATFKTRSHLVYMLTCTEINRGINERKFIDSFISLLCVWNCDKNKCFSAGIILLKKKSLKNNNQQKKVIHTQTYNPFQIKENIMGKLKSNRCHEAEVTIYTHITSCKMEKLETRIIIYATSFIPLNFGQLASDASCMI